MSRTSERWLKTHVKCDFCGKWYNPEDNKIYNIADQRSELGVSRDKEYCCYKCYDKLKRGKIK